MTLGVPEGCFAGNDWRSNPFGSNSRHVRQLAWAIGGLFRFRDLNCAILDDSSGERLLVARRPVDFDPFNFLRVPEAEIERQGTLREVA